MKRILLVLVIVVVSVFSGCVGGTEDDLIVREEEPELISRWEDDIQPKKEIVLIERSIISKVDGEYSLTDETEGKYELLEKIDNDGEYISRVDTNNTGQINAMPYELTWEARGGYKSLSKSAVASQIEMKEFSEDFVDLFFAGDEYVDSSKVAAFFAGDQY